MEFVVNLVRTVAAKMKPNRCVLIWLDMVIIGLRFFSNLVMNDECAKLFWTPLINPVILNLEKTSVAPDDMPVHDTPNIASNPVECVCVAEIVVPASSYD